MSESKDTRPAFSLGALQAGAKSLRETEGPSSSAGAKGDGETEEMNATLVALYEKFSGNLDDIFEELGEDPGKAKVGSCFWC
ncbi:hypothetical protein TrRE_jg2922 [Triparma retinervis]|uniref:Uncharacterized protein n=1 Tax=Triparma retinervis TaxID=2557542 RepID=A0A9W6ZNK3_9STRA|nr:hypothetical protein TrRE_jg2922 [Triparma retinervis]